MFVDEAQDLNAAQLELVMLQFAPGGRLLFVGDSRQAIYGFSGSDTQSIPNIVKRTQAKVLPLSICYRCPSSHLDLAREIVSHIEAASGARVGSVKDISEEKLLTTAGEGDLIVAA